MTTRTALLFRFVPFVLLAATLGSAGCATEQKTLRTSRYVLNYPGYWKVDAVAQKDGEPTKLTIGKYSETVMTSGEGSAAGSIYETQQADVDARIYTWPAPADVADPNHKVFELLYDAPDLQLGKNGKLPEQRQECGNDFKRKFTILGAEHDTLDLASRPGHRVIVLGTTANGTLLGVVTRVPYEQDAGLFCYNLANMKTQLQTLLDGLSLVPGQPAPAAGAAPAAGSSPPAPPASPGK